MCGIDDSPTAGNQHPMFFSIVTRGGILNSYFPRDTQWMATVMKAHLGSRNNKSCQYYTDAVISASSWVNAIHFLY